MCPWDDQGLARQGGVATGWNRWNLRRGFPGTDTIFSWRWQTTSRQYT